MRLSAVQRYDANADTGNEVLDVVLTEKSMHCEARHITLNCVADGSARWLRAGRPVRPLQCAGSAIDAAARQMDERAGCTIDRWSVSGRASRSSTSSHLAVTEGFARRPPA